MPTLKKTRDMKVLAKLHVPHGCGICSRSSEALNVKKGWLGHSGLVAENKFANFCKIGVIERCWLEGWMSLTCGSLRWA